MSSSSSNSNSTVVLVTVVVITLTTAETRLEQQASLQRLLITTMKSWRIVFIIVGTAGVAGAVTIIIMQGEILILILRR